MKKKNKYNYFDDYDYDTEDSPYDFTAVDLRGENSRSDSDDDFADFGFEDDSYGDLPFEEDLELVDEDFDLKTVTDDPEEDVSDTIAEDVESFVLDRPDDAPEFTEEFLDDEADEEVSAPQRKFLRKKVVPAEKVPVATVPPAPVVIPVETKNAVAATVTPVIPADVSSGPRRVVPKMRDSALQPLLVLSRSKHSFDHSKKKLKDTDKASESAVDDFDDFEDDLSGVTDDDIENMSDDLSEELVSESTEISDEDEIVVTPVAGETDEVVESVPVESDDISVDVSAESDAVRGDVSETEHTESYADIDSRDSEESFETDISEESSDTIGTVETDENDLIEDNSSDEENISEDFESDGESVVETVGGIPDLEISEERNEIFNDSPEELQDEIPEESSKRIFFDEPEDADIFRLMKLTDAVDVPTEDEMSTKKKNESESVSPETEEKVSTSQTADTSETAKKAEDPHSGIVARKKARKLKRKKQKRKKKVKDTVKEVFSWIGLVVAAFLIAIVINLYVARPSVVSGRSMMPTLLDGDTIVISKLPYMLGDVKYGDIVVIDRNESRERTFSVEVIESLKYNVLTQSLFDKNELHDDIFWVKRVIGLPGDVIEFYNGKVYRNGEMLTEDYILTQDVTNYPEGEQVVVQEGCVFVMGDNRNESHDSRNLAQQKKQIEIDYIVGKLISK